MSAILVAVAIHRGGCGKTVTSMALSSSLARRGNRVLLTDLDPQGHSTMGLGIELAPEDLTLREFFAEPPTDIRRVIRDTAVPGLSIAPSNIRLAREARNLYTRPRREEVLNRGLNPVRSDFDFIIADCPPSLSPLLEAGIGAADFVVVPVQMEARASDGLQDLLEVLTAIKGDQFEQWRILRTRVDARSTITNEAALRGLQPWRDHLFEVEIPQSQPLNQAQFMGQDIFSFDPKSKGALAYEQFTEEFLSHIHSLTHV